MSFFKLSPNEVDRLFQEEIRKLKIERLKQVREQAKAQSVKLRRSVEDEKKRLQQIAQNKLKSQWQAEHSKQILKAEDNLKNTLLEIGGSHRNAVELNVDLLDKEKTSKDVENQCTALKREKEALASMRDEKEKQESKHMQQLLDRHCALDIEKARASMVASLPKPPPRAEPPEEPPIPKAHSRTSGMSKVIVEKENVDSNFQAWTALDEAEILERRFESLEEKKQRVIRERRQNALLRHKEALVREHQTKEQQVIEQELEDIRKEKIAVKKSEIDKLSKQVLMNNLKQKEKADQEELEAEQIHYENCEDTKGQTSNNGDATSELCYTSSLPFDDASVCDVNTSESISPTTVREKGASDDEGASHPTKSQDTRSHDFNSKQPDEVHQHLGFHLDEQVRKRLIELVQRQKNAAAKQTQVLSSVGLKKDAALQTNLDSSFGLSTKKHEAVQVIMEELEDGIEADWNVSNSFIPSFHSIEAPSFDSVLPVEDIDHEDHGILDIRKRKHELINELKAIDQEMTKMLYSNDDDNPPLDEKTTVAKDPTEKHLPKGIHHSPDIIIPSIYRSLNESHSSSNASTQYLHLPTHRNTSSSSNSKAGNVMELYDSETSQISIGDATSPLKDSDNHLQTNQSPCSSTKTDYHSIPTSRRKINGNSLSESSLHSSTCDLPSISSKASTSLKSLSIQKGLAQSPKYMLRGGGDLVLPDPSGSTGIKIGLKSSILNHATPPDLPNLLEYLDPNSSLGSGSVDSHISERDSIVSLEFQNREGNSEKLSSHRESSSALNTIVSKFIHFRSPKSTVPHESGSSTSDVSDPFNTSRSSEHNFAWLDFLKPLHAMNSAIDINSERASLISVELLNPETESTELSAEQESPSIIKKPWKIMNIFHSENSNIAKSSISLNNSKEITNDHSEYTDSDISKGFDENQILNYHQTRNWLKILEPYREPPESTAKTLQVYNDNKINDTKDDFVSCSGTSQFYGIGILDEPDLTLTSANSTMSMPFDSPQHSGLMSSSLHSFERHEINFLQQSMDQSSELPSVAMEILSLQSIDNIAPPTSQAGVSCGSEQAEPQASRQMNLMYPRKCEIENNLKGTLDSWKRSRAVISQKLARPNDSKNGTNK